MQEKAFDLINPHGRFPVVLTCEHASCAVPSEYRGLGISDEDIHRHIGWDIGARAVIEALAQVMDAPAVCSGYSRLLIDCNRDLSDHDLIVLESDGTKILANQNLSPEERDKRIIRFYQPYHETIDRLIRTKWTKDLTLLSVHSFTPALRKNERKFDLGILFDRYEDLAQEVGQRLSLCGYQVRYNEPYSGYDGLIFSARSHGERHKIIYLEIEINNRLIANPEQAAHIGKVLGSVFQDIFPWKTDKH
jgi:predicted N-formylglutamate amidohydrolase